MVRRYRSAGDGASTTLNGAVTDSATSWTVADGSVFPSEGDYYIARGAEIVLVTHRSTNVLTVIRAQSGTTAIAHSDGETVTSILTADELENRRRECNRFKMMDYGRITDANDNIMTASDFTALGVTAPELEDGEGGVIQSWAHATHTNEGRLMGGTRPLSAVDRTYYAHISSMETYDEALNQARFAFMIRPGSGGNDMYGIHLRPGIEIAVGFQSSGWLNNGFTTTYDSHGAWGRNDFWAKITAEWNWMASSERFTYSYSWDGVHWFQFHQHDFASATGTVGFWCSNGRQDSSTPYDGLTGVRCMSWWTENL